MANSKITKDTINAVIKKGITKEAAFLVFEVGTVTSTIGSVLGYNVIQTILLQTIYRYFGVWTAIEAMLGIGAAGVAMTVARFAGPIALALSTAYTAHQIAGPAYRKTVPAVIWVAQKRLEMFSV